MFKEKINPLFGGIFNIPNIVGRQYATGAQPNTSGETVTPWQGSVYELKAWPNTVPSLNVLANNSGVPHSRAPIPVIDQYAYSPENYLFIGGTVSKSGG